MSNVFEEKKTYAYIIIAVVAVIIICLFIWFSDCANQYCFANLEKPALSCNKCVNMFFVILLFTILTFAGFVCDYYCVQRGVNNGTYKSLQLLWLALVLLFIIWFVLVFTVVNLYGALICVFFINIFTAATLYVCGSVQGQASWIYAALMLFTLILLAYTMCLYNANKCNPCVRNTHFC